MISTTGGQDFDNSQISNLTFIDTNLTNYQSLIPDSNNSNIVLIDSQKNGIEQITETLEKYSNLDSVSILSHGDVGLVQLGNTYLSDSNLGNYQADLAAWGDALSATGDLLLYGCNVGASIAGNEFVKEFADLTGADVAASDDLTGNATLDGDWTLEVVTGKIETQTFTLTEYGSLLAISQQDLLSGKTADFNGDGKADILRQEKGTWGYDDSETVNLLISNGSGFSPYDLTQDMAEIVGGRNPWYEAIRGDKSTFFAGDFNGDGKSDLLYTGINDNWSSLHLLTSSGSGFIGTTLSDTGIYGDFSNIHIGDFNGDGKSDFVAQEKEYFAGNDDDSSFADLYLSTGTNFTRSTLEIGTSLNGNHTNLHVGDFNGDGKSDLFRQEKNDWDDDSSSTADLLISTGTNFTKISLPESLHIKGDKVKLHVGDFNGDGKDDILGQEKGLWDQNNNYYWDARLLISNGSGFSKSSLGSLTSTVKGNYTNLHVGDFNGDGKDDILRQEKSHWDNDNYNTANLLISQGSYFSKYNLSESFDLEGDYTNLYVGDFNGDGRSDLLRQETDAWAGDGAGEANLLFSTGTNFSRTTLPSSLKLNGNYTNLYTNNLNSNHLRFNEKEGLKFHFTHDNDVPWGMIRSFELAGQVWSQYLQDDVTINIHIDAASNSELPTNTLGGAVPFFYQGTSYTDFKNKLAQEVDTQNGNYDDQTAVANIPTGSGFWNLTPSGWQWFDNIAMTRANAKALGVVNGDDTTLDGTIVMNDLVGTGASWVYDYSSFGTMSDSQINFNTVAMHEIGHILGFVSLADGLTQENYNDMDLIGDSYTPLDLYRFDNNNGLFDRGTAYRTLSPANAVFSIDRKNDLARMSNGTEAVGGATAFDGYQASHWKNEDNAGIMDPLLETNTRRQIGELDLRALDVIGWDRNFMDLAIQTDENAQYPLAADSIRNIYDDTHTMNRNVEVGEMLEDWRWARRGSRDTLRQEGNIATFLAQEGFFSVGSFRESFDFSSVNPVQDNSLVVVVDNQIKPQEFAINNDLDLVNDSEVISPVNLPKIAEENEGTNYEQMVALVTEGLSDTQLSQLSLDDLGKLIEQELERVVV